MKTDDIKLVDDQNSKATKVTDQVYQDFVARYQAQVKPDLDKYREARRISEEEAKRHLVF